MKNILIVLFVSLLFLFSCEDDNPVNEKKIEPKFKITKLSPAYGLPRYDFNIIGEGFGTDPTLLTVYIDDKEVYATLLNDTTIKTIVPESASGFLQIKVKVGDVIVSAPELFEVIDNTKLNNVYITYVYPDSVQRGDTINIVTKNYGVTQDKITFLVGNVETNCVSFCDTIVKIVIPENAYFGKNNVGFRYRYDGNLITHNSPNQILVYNEFSQLYELQFWISNILVRRNTKSRYSDRTSSGSSESNDTILSSYYYNFSEEDIKHSGFQDYSVKDTIYMFVNKGMYTGRSFKCKIDTANKMINYLYSHSTNPVEYTDVFKSFITFAQSAYNVPYTINTNKQYVASISGTNLGDINFGFSRYFEHSYRWNHTSSDTEERDIFLSNTDSTFVKIILTPK